MKVVKCIYCKIPNVIAPLTPPFPNPRTNFAVSSNISLGTLIVSTTKCNIYISHLCYDVSVHLSVTFVHCGHRVQWILDIFACLDRWMSLLLTDNASSRSSDGMLPGFLVEKLVIVAISLNLLTESLLYGWTRNSWCWHLSDFII